MQVSERSFIRLQRAEYQGASELERGVSTEEVLCKMKESHSEKVAQLKMAHQEVRCCWFRSFVVVCFSAQLDGEIDDAERQCKEIECAICMEEFDDAKPRALYAACGHARICLPCSNDNWRKNNRKCPLCNHEQQDKSKKLPQKVFF